MKNYIRPAIEITDRLAEGVYMLSGSQEVSVNEALNAATGEEQIEADTNAADLTTVADNSAGDTESEGSTLENGPATAETPASTETQETQDTSTDTDTDATDNVVVESAEMQNSARVTCDSKYMDGTWQGTKEGSWGGLKLGCKEVLGCKDCPADKGNGCGLQDANAASLYFQEIGMLMPGWEASGKLPTDSPYGI